MADDRVTAYLAEVRKDVRQRDELVARMRTASVSAVEFNAAQDRLAEHGPRLLAAVEWVLELTRDVVGDLPGECDVSVSALREAISRALLGGE